MTKIPPLSTYRAREKAHGFCKGWGKRLHEAQQIDRYPECKNPRIRCGNEHGMAHLIPPPGRLCHDCGAARGEYHVPGCDAEECPDCHEQALGRDCIA